MRKHILEIDSVQKSFEGKSILSDVYLKFETGEIVGLLGRNGCGKSTLLKIIFGIESANNKFIRIDGTVKNQTSSLLKEVSYLHQENFIPSNFSVKKAISLAIEKSEIAKFLEDELIKSIIDKNIRSLSGGETRYLEIKLILSNFSKFVLLDEPYNGLSPLMVEKTNILILENSRQKGIIITDHNYEKVINIATKLILMKEGKVFHLKDKSELVEKGYLRGGML